MRNLSSIFLLSLSLAYSSLLCSGEAQDHWKGDEYAKNSQSQKASAEDFIQQVQLKNSSVNLSISSLDLVLEDRDCASSPFKGTESILDVGCGDGRITVAMAKRVPGGSVIGVDISSSMIQAAQNAFCNQPNLSFSVQDAAKIHYDQEFDLITSFTVMQWVLEQKAALQCFEKALKPGGKLWIQMPTGLPKAMQHALDKTLSSPRWKSFFLGFSAPWKFYQADEYQPLLLSAHLTPKRLEVTTKHEYFPSRAAFHGFLKQWFPYLRPLPLDQKDAFLTDLLDSYLSILPPDSQGRVSFIVDRLEVEALKLP